MLLIAQSQRYTAQVTAEASEVAAARTTIRTSAQRSAKRSTRTEIYLAQSKKVKLGYIIVRSKA